MLPADRVAPRWTQPVEERGRKSLMGRVTLKGQGIAGATVTALAQHGEEVLSDLDCKCDNHCGLKLLACGCPEAAGQLVELVATRRGEGIPLARAQTDADGQFVLDGLDDTQLAVWADAASGVGLTLGVRSGDAPFDVELSPGRMLEGTVQGGDEKPLQGAVVTAIAAAHARFFDTVTDAAGHFKVGPVPDGQVSLVAMRDGLLPDHEGVRDGPGNKLLFTLDVPRSLSGLVQRDDEPVASATVTLEGQHRKRSTTADAQGAFRFDRLRPGEYEITAEASGSRGRLETRVAKLEDRSGVVVALRAGGDVRGLVLDEHGAPVPEASISARDGAEWRKARTDDAGRFVLAAMSLTEVFVTATKRGFLEAEATKVQVRETGTDVQLVLTHAAEISGRVVTEDGVLVGEFEARALRPTDGGDPEVERSTWSTRSGDQTSSKDGGFSLFVEPGAWEVQVQSSAHVPATALVVAPSRDVVVTVRAGARIVGEVLGTAGQPLPGAMVMAIPVDGSGKVVFSMMRGPSGPQPTKADEQGHFELSGVQAGRFQVSAMLGEGAMQTIPGEVVQVPERGTLRVVIRAKRGQTVSGRLVDDKGKGVAGAQVMAYQVPEGADGEGMPRTAAAQTDATGAFLLEGLEAGPAQLRAVAPRTQRRVERAVVVPATNVTLQLEVETVISGRVVGDGKRPLTAFRVNAQHFDDAEGRFTMPAQKGAMRLGFDAEGYAQKLVVFPAREGKNALGDVVMSRGRPLLGTVTDKVTGKPVAGALVDIDAQQPDMPLDRDFVLSPERGAVTTGADGRYRLEHVDPSSDVVAVTHEDYLSSMQPIPRGATTKDVALEPGGRIDVTVLDGAGKATMAAYVMGVGPKDRRAHFRPRPPPATGFTAGGLAPGTWRIRVEGPRNYQSETVVLNGGAQAVTVREVSGGAELVVTGAPKQVMMVLVAAPTPAEVTPRWLFDGTHEARNAENGTFSHISPGTWTLAVLKMSPTSKEVSVQQVQVGTEPRQTVEVTLRWKKLELPEGVPP